jgi:hypothetical protein
MANKTKRMRKRARREKHKAMRRETQKRDVSIVEKKKTALRTGSPWPDQSLFDFLAVEAYGVRRHLRLVS